MKSIAIDVWLDGQDVVRRMEATAEVESKDHSVGRVDNVMDFYDFGAALHIEPPPADLVGEAPVSPGGPSTTTTVFRPGHLGNELLTFQPVQATASPPCEPPGLPSSDKSECMTVGDIKWTRPVLESAEATAMTAGQWVVDVVLTQKAIDQFNQIADECYAKAPSVRPDALPSS